MSILKNILVVLLIIASGQTGYAQKSGYFTQDENQIFYGGITLGGNFSTVDGDSYGGYKKAGFVGGPTVYIRLLPSLLANIELLYSQKGSRGVFMDYSYQVGDYFERYWLDINYIEVPLIFSYNFRPRWHISLGGAYGQLVGVPREEVYSYQPYTLDPESSDFNKSDVSIVFGGMYQLSDGWFLSGRWQRSVMTIRESENIPVWQATARQYNDLFSLRLVYLIR